MLIGVAYHPEHWPAERWREDARLMKEAGFNAVRLGEFAWSHLEPVRGKFRFKWLENAVKVFADHGIRSVLCTPTACPPPWLVERHPSLPPTTADGRQLAYGACRSYCVNNPSQHKYAQGITSALAAHFKGNKHLLAWQVDSGFGRFGTARCYCKNCAQGFREWLQKKYGSLENLNQSWGTVFWSQGYSDWQQVPLPWRAVGDGELPHNPALSLDYRRFCSDSWVAFQRLLAGTLRLNCPGVPVTHNIPASVTEIDPFKLAGDLDVASVSLADGARGYGSDTRLFLEMAYALKGRGFWAMDVDETAPLGTNAFRPQSIFPAVYAAVARGAEAVFFSRWRPAPFGAEQLRPGLLNHDGSPGRLLEAASRVGRVLAKNNKVIQRNEAGSEAALLICHESAWALGEKPEPDIDYWGYATATYAALSHQVSSLSVVGPGARLSQFKLVVAPALYIMQEDVARKLREYVEKGGRLALTCMSGIKDAENNVWTSGLPGGMQETLGIAVKGFESVKHENAEGKIRVVATDRTFRTRRWNDQIELRQAKLLAVYADGPLRGLPAVTMNALGNGRAYYIGTCAEPDFYQYLLGLACREAGIAPRPFTADGVEVIARGDLTHVINQSFEPQAVTLDGFYEDLLRATKYRGKIAVPPDGALVLKRIG